jgi:hypothetical protein
MNKLDEEINNIIKEILNEYLILLKNTIVEYNKFKVKKLIDCTLKDNDIIINNNYNNCINYHLDEINNQIVIGFSGSITMNDFYVNINIGYTFFHKEIFKSCLYFLFKNKRILYNIIMKNINENKKVSLCGWSLGGAFAIYTLIFFIYIK